MKYAMVEDGSVTNLVEWDGEVAFKLPKGISLIEDDGFCVVGSSTYSDGAFNHAAIPEADPSIAEHIRVWDLAVEHYMENGTHEFTDGRAQRCVASNRIPAPDSPCWGIYEAAYPIGG